MYMKMSMKNSRKNPSENLFKSPLFRASHGCCSCLWTAQYNWHL